MKFPLSLIGWLALLVGVEGASWLLDSFHYLLWGRLGLYLLKSGYVGFAVILLIRYLSFRSQKVFEGMVDAYNRLSETPWPVLQEAKSAFHKYIFHGLLIVSASSDFLSLFSWSRASFRATLALDFAVWILALRWIVRAHWLKAQRRRERLKEFLDDARSRQRSGVAIEMPARRKSALLPYAALTIAVLSITVFVAATRWSRADVVFRVDDLKACAEICFREESEGYFQQGRLDERVLRYPCLARRRDSLQVTLGLNQGEPFLRARETESIDYFGNGKRGDETLELGSGGRFRKIAAEDP